MFLIFAIIVEAIIICILLWGLWRVSQHNFILTDTQDEIAELISTTTRNLKILEHRFEDRSKMDLFLDEPVIRETMADITSAKELMKKISDVLESSLEDENEED